MSPDYFRHVKQFLASNKAEALAWLQAASDTSFRSLGELDLENSLSFVQHLYALGAESVLAVQIDEYDEEEDGAAGQNTGHVLVQLPPDNRSRDSIFAFGREHAESQGFDGTPDEGQEYLYFKMD